MEAQKKLNNEEKMDFAEKTFIQCLLDFGFDLGILAKFTERADRDRRKLIEELIDNIPDGVEKYRRINALERVHKSTTSGIFASILRRASYQELQESTQFSDKHVRTILSYKKHKDTRDAIRFTCHQIELLGNQITQETVRNFRFGLLRFWRNRLEVERTTAVIGHGSDPGLHQVNTFLRLLETHN